VADSAPKHIVAASALIRNERGEIALVRTERRGWELPGGQIELGETLTDGLRREIMEECGLSVELGRLLHVRSNLSTSIVIFCFGAAYVSGDLKPSAETPEVCWADAETALELVKYPALGASLRDMLREDGRMRYYAYRTNPFELVESRAI
jgi:ADP-ribose pyrophosphatase YjhB (NUDIX family)